ncbi:signal peptidase I [soil metagenome]
MKIMHTDEQNPPASLPPENKKTSFWKELFKLLLLAVFVVIPFRLYIAQPFIVDGASMDPTFRTGQYLIVDELTYHFTTPARGSVLIFKYPKDPSKYFIKRIIGLPGETVVLKDGAVTIKNPAQPQGFALNEPYVIYSKPDTNEYVLGPDEYFVMGDNRLGSSDSRVWGPVPKANIIGRPFVRFLPPTVWPGDRTSLLREDSPKNA